MLIFDTETTGLVQPALVPLAEQPEIIEFAGIKIDDFTFEETERLTFLCKPRNPISEEITKITGITNEDLINEKSFAAYYHELANFFLGESIMVAHNLSFDHSMLRFELERIGKECAFPWPFKQVCTVEASFSINNKRMRLCDLHQLACGEDFKDAHRAMADTEALLRCVRWLISKELM